MPLPWKRVLWTFTLREEEGAQERVQYLPLGILITLITFALALFLFWFSFSSKRSGAPWLRGEQRAFREAARVKGLNFEPGGFIRSYGLRGVHRGRRVEVKRVNRKLVRFRVGHACYYDQLEPGLLLRVATPERPFKGARLEGLDPVFESEFTLGGQREAARFLLSSPIKENLYAIRDVMGYFEVIFYNARRRGGSIACFSSIPFVSHDDIIAVINQLIQLAERVEKQG